MDLKQYIRDIPDFPVEGILFRDITPLMQEPEAFRYVIDRMAEHYEGQEIDVILGIEARGFLIGAPLAYTLGKPFVPVRKEGRLPYETMSVKYALEYGQSVVEVHTDAVSKGQRAIILDDLLATGGTMAAGGRIGRGDGGRGRRSGGGDRAHRPGRTRASERLRRVLSRAVLREIA